jgi:hypothetical protein
MEGWIKLYRQLFDNTLWLSEPFTRGQAWIDLLLLANYEPSFYYKRGNKINIERGQIGRSEVELSDRWHWSRTKLRKYLNDLEKEQQIIQHKSTVTLIITVVNYDKYQEKEQQVRQQKNSRKTAEKHIKEYKEEKECKEEVLHTYTWRENFDVYLKDCREAFVKFDSDENIIKKQERLNPNVDIKLTIEKAYDKFWATEAGWKNKKSSKTENIDWNATIKNAISNKSNIVYKNKLF